MDTLSLRGVNRPADGNDTLRSNSLKVFNKLSNGDGVSEEQQVSARSPNDNHSNASDGDLPTVTKLQNELPAGAPSQKRSATFIHITAFDTESEGDMTQSPDRSRKPSKVLGRKESFPTPAEPVYAKAPNTNNRRKVVVYSSAESVVTDSEADDDDYTISKIERLEEEIQDLEAKLKRKDSRAAQQAQSEPSRYQILYCLGYEVRPNVRGTSSDEYSSASGSEEQDQRENNWYTYAEPPGRQTSSFNIFTDPPVLTQDPEGSVSLHCSHRVENLKRFLKSNPEISFVVFHDYNRFPKARADSENLDNEASSQPMPRARSIYPVSKELKGALDLVLKDRVEYSSMLSKFWSTGELSAPYLFVYHSRQKLSTIKEALSKEAQGQLDLFLEYVMKEFGEEYNTVDTLLKRKEILPQYLQYLVKKGDILVENRNGEYTGYKAESWPVESIRATLSPSIAIKYGMPGNSYESSVTHKWTLNGFTWGFDGNFFGRWKQLKLEMSQNSGLEKAVGNTTGAVQVKGQPITNLAVFPLHYAPDHIQQMLYHRGDVLWKCRVRQLVSYQTTEQDPIGNGMEEQYMIDMKTYQSLQPKKNTPINTMFRPYPLTHQQLLSKKRMARIDPPGDDFKVLMPPRIEGYNFYQKKWCDLKVDQISDLVWRGEAFDTLEIDYEAKDLIQALVTNYQGIEKVADCVAGKGNNLTILLHGGPGTGKTHTAESVAEIAKKPLYRVACSDLGTKAEVVEGNLESALYLARLWGCVVLLDEADVFLEQTDLGDLERNALTSVFSRMVKSFDGIVVLTSSRVNIFNEAFRSQIQLALHFPALTSFQRFFIWKTFICQLEFSSEDADIPDLYEQAAILADEKLNGRQIRNVLANARRFARWKKAPLNYYHIKHMIELSGRFDTFIGDRDGGDTQDEFAADEWLR